MFDGLQILSNTPPNTIKQHQTRCPNAGKMFGHQTMVDGVWLPNISHLFRALLTKPMGLDKREMFGDQTPSNIASFGDQTC